MTPTQLNEIVRLWTPLITGLILLVYGLIASEATWIAIGAGALGLPGFVATTKGAGDSSGGTTTPKT